MQIEIYACDILKQSSKKLRSETERNESRNPISSPPQQPQTLATTLGNWCLWSSDAGDSDGQNADRGDGCGANESGTAGDPLHIDVITHFN